MKISLEISKKIGDFFKVNYDVVNLEQLHDGLNIELEHKNITDGDLHKTAKIALAHLEEFPDYYIRLKKMEKQAEKYWSNKDKPSIYLSS